MKNGPECLSLCLLFIASSGCRARTDCATVLLSEAAAADVAHFARLVSRDCGATTPVVTEVQLATSPDQADHTTVFRARGGTVAVSLWWSGPTQLTVYYFLGAGGGVLDVVRSAKGTEVVPVELAPRVRDGP